MDDIHTVLCCCLDHGLHTQVREGSEGGQSTPAVIPDLAGHEALCGGVDGLESRIPQHCCDILYVISIKERRRRRVEWSCSKEESRVKRRRLKRGVR